jgi:hypothetical protein
MTPTEVLSEIQKMPLAQKRRVFSELNEQLERTDADAKEKKFVNGLR